MDDFIVIMGCMELFSNNSTRYRYFHVPRHGGQGFGWLVFRAPLSAHAEFRPNVLALLTGYLNRHRSNLVCRDVISVLESRIWAFVVLSPYTRLNTVGCGSVANSPFGNRTRGVRKGDSIGASGDGD